MITKGEGFYLAIKNLRHPEWVAEETCYLKLFTIGGSISTLTILIPNLSKKSSFYLLTEKNLPQQSLFLPFLYLPVDEHINTKKFYVHLFYKFKTGSLSSCSYLVSVFVLVVLIFTKRFNSVSNQITFFISVKGVLVLI